MNQYLIQPFEQLVQAYNQLPEAWTRRFERIDEQDSLILRHRTVNLNVELAPLESIPLDPEVDLYLPVARFQASLYASLEGITSLEEVIEALRILQEREETLHLSLPSFGREQITFGHYDGGVEYTINIPRVRLERPAIVLPEYNLPDLMRSFSFIPYNFNLDVGIPFYHQGTEEFNRQVGEYLQEYETRNPTARIIGQSSNNLNFWSEDEQTLRETSRDLQTIAKYVQSRLQCRDTFRITNTIRSRNQG